MTVAKLASITMFALMVLHGPAIADFKYGRILGGVNLDYYCKSVHGNNSGTFRVGDAWRCKKKHARNGVAISVEHACQQQYGRNDVKARYRTSDNSWVCVVPSHH